MLWNAVSFSQKVAIGLCIAAIAAVGIYDVHSGIFLHPSGSILYGSDGSPGDPMIPSRNEKAVEGIYRFSFSKEGKGGLFFCYPGGYAGYNNPTIEDGNFFCGAYKMDAMVSHDLRYWEEHAEFTIFAIQDYKQQMPLAEHAEILLQTKGIIGTFAVRKDQKKIYYTKYKSSKTEKTSALYLYAFDCAANQEIQISEEPLAERSKLLLTDDDALIYAKEDTSATPDGISIIKRYPSGEIEVLVKDAVHFNWYEKNKSILYNDKDETLYIFDLGTKEKQLYAQTDWIGLPLMSPDRNYLLVMRENPNYGVITCIPSVLNFITRAPYIEMREMPLFFLANKRNPIWVDELSN